MLKGLSVMRLLLSCFILLVEPNLVFALQPIFTLSLSRNDLIEIRSFWCYFDSTGSVETREAHCLRCYPCFMVTSLTIWQSFAATLVTLSIF